MAYFGRFSAPFFCRQLAVDSPQKPARAIIIDGEVVKLYRCPVPRTLDRTAEEKLIAGLAAGKTIGEAASIAEISERTAHRRLADPAFRQRVMEVRHSAIASATAVLLAGMKDASRVLNLLLVHENPRIQLTAAVKSIELAAKLNAMTELERRLQQLERFLKIHVPDS